MNHGRKNRKFSRENKQRKALLRDLANALITNGRVSTTQAKAKSLRPYIEKMITRAKTKNLANTRLLSSQLGVASAKKLFSETGDKFASRNGGYTRIINLPPRLSDGSKMAIIELVK